MFTVQFTKRDFTGPAQPGPVRLGVEQLEWRAMGGPYAARLRADAQNQAGLWGLVDLLRCGLTVTDNRGPAWWGYVSTVELHDGARVLRISLDEMGNKVSVGYQDFAGSRFVTGWASDADSIRAYGEKERMFQLKGSSASEAGAYAVSMLARVGKPVSSARLAEETKGLYAIIEARGWWASLDWKFYHESRGMVGWMEGGSSQNWGNDAASQRVSWAVAIPAGDAWSVSEVWVKLRRFRAADAVTLKLQTNAGGVPGGDIITCTLPASSIPDAMNWVRFALAAPTALTPGATYFLSLYRAGSSTDPLTYYTVSVDESLGNAGSSLLLWNGSAYVARIPDADIAFQMIGTEETTEQVRRILAGAQFLAGVRMEVSSGIQAQMFQDGSLRAQARAEQLLKIGASGGGRLLARVEVDRVARVYTAPSEPAGLVLGHNGQVRRIDGRALDASEWPAGQWVGLGPLAGSAGGLVNGAGVFVEGCTWSAAGMRLSQA